MKTKEIVFLKLPDVGLVVVVVVVVVVGREGEGGVRGYWVCPLTIIKDPLIKNPICVSLRSHRNEIRKVTDG